MGATVTKEGNMRKEYEEELQNLKEKMEKAEKFAGRLPLFSNTILVNKFTGEEDWLHISDVYKKMYFGWGIKRGFYNNNNARKISNFSKDGEYSAYLFNIYINTISLFGIHQEFDLYDYLSNVKIFFADKYNTTFYIEDEHIEAFLEAINLWFCDASNKIREVRRQEKISKLRAELEREEREE